MNWPMSITLVADREVDPLLVRAYRDGRLKAWAVCDQFGWAIMARVPVAGESWVKTVDRYEADEPSAGTRAAALTGLRRFAATGRTDVRGTWCDCQHRTDRQPAVLLGVASPPCTCTEQVDLGRGVFAVPPPAGCPTHGDEVRWLRAVEA